MSASNVSSSTSPPSPFYETVSPPFAAALIAAGQLVYLNCKLHPNGKNVVYVFDDPLHIGEELQRRYATSIFPLVHPKLLADVRNKLMEDANRVKGGRDASKSSL
jgi:hypothetical protein